MNTNNEEFLMLFYNQEWYRDLSPEEMQTTMSQWMDWFNGLVEAGKCKGGHPLAADGWTVTGRSAAISDGPFAETKESVGGFFHLTVSGPEEALEIAKDCPGLPYGITVEIRPIQPRCTAAELAEQAAMAG